MKRLLFLILFLPLLAISQVVPPDATPLENIQITNNVQSTTATNASVQESNGVLNRIPINALPITLTPVNYAIPNNQIISHLSGIDTRLGQISSTSAGITQRVYFTADNITITAGTFFASSLTGKGTTPSGSPPALVLPDDTKGYFTKDIISSGFAAATIAYAGTYSGNLTVSATTTPNATQQRFTVEIYKTDNSGNPIPSGVPGVPTGNLGVTVFAILDSGVINLVAGAITNVPISGILTQNTTLNVGERLRYHVSAAKIGAGGGSVTFGVYYGNAYNSYYDVAVAVKASAVVNDALGITGITVADALNNLNAKIPVVYSNVVYVDNVNPNSATIFDLNNPPTVNDNGLKANVNNIYIGTDASTWVYNSTSLNYVTKVLTSDVFTGKFINPNGTKNDILVADGSFRTISTMKNGYIESLQPYNQNLNNMNNARSVDLITRKNIVNNSETYTSGNLVSTSSGGTIDNADVIYYNGIKLARGKNASYFSNASVRQTNLVVGKRYMFSYYIKSNVGEKWIYDDIENSSGSGHRRRFIDRNVRRVSFIGQAVSTSSVDKFINPTVAMGSGSGNFFVIGATKVLSGVQGDYYFGGLQIEEVPNTYVDGIAWIGDSTFQSDAGSNNYYLNTSIPTMVGDILNVSCFNKAVAGERLDQMDARWATSITPLAVNSKYVVIQGGVNDIGQGTRTLADMQASIISMNSKALADNLKPIFITCSPTNNFNSTQETLRDDFNAWLKLTYKQVIDINEVLEFNNKLNNGFPLFVSDGVHYGIELRKAVASYIAKSSFFEFLQPSDYQLTTTVYTGQDLSIKNITQSGNRTISTVPATSAGTYDLVSRNISTGVEEKVPSNTYATTVSPAFTGTPTAPTPTAGTNTTQVATTAFVQSVTRPYKSYAALVSQTGTDAPTVTVLENTLSGTIVWTRTGTGSYNGTLSGEFLSNKTFALSGEVPSTAVKVSLSRASDNIVSLYTSSSGTLQDGLVSNTPIEIRVYN